MITGIMTVVFHLVQIEIYEDKDSARKDEIAASGGQTATGTNVFSAFYDGLKEIREYHRKHPAARVVDASEEYESMLKEEPVIEFKEPVIEFSGEEAYGRYLDLHELYHRYINSKFGQQIEYSAYLDVFSQPQSVPRKLKMSRQYREYMSNLLEYLIYFFQRTEPLQDLDRVFSKVAADFEEQWASSMVQGWENESEENGHLPSQDTVIDLDYYSTVEELMEVGPEKLKEALAALGLKSGGTVQQRVERLFLTKHTPLEKLDKKHFAKASRGVEQNRATAAAKYVNNLKDVALMEAKLKKLCELLEETIERTKQNVEKKQALTYEEMEAKRKRRHKLIQKVTMTNSRFTILLNCQWVGNLGMGSLYLIGYTSFMVLVRNSSVRYVETTVTWGVELSSDTLRNGGISMGCVALVFQTPKTSMRSLQSRKVKNYGREYGNDKE